jgi:N-formylglutamate deformylase
MSTFRVQVPSRGRVPILLSIPHCGTSFPEEIADEYVETLARDPDDTDYFVDRLYDFASDMGISTITAVYSRWVIDLNRDPSDKPLYGDGRIITSLCPVTTFLGEPLYRDGRKEVASQEITRRVEQYYRPYHDKVRELLDSIRNEFGKVLLWECHSIRQHVRTVYPDPIPDLILGDNEGRSCNKQFVRIALEGLKQGSYELNHNQPFKGGYITRHFGNPADHIHALQLEMTKCRYMDDAEKRYDQTRAKKMRAVLRNTLNGLSEALLPA